MKIGYIDHSFHQKTQSSNFFVEILERNGLEVEYIWDDSWKGGKPIVLDDIISSYDAFIFHQVTAVSSRPFYKLPANITFLPMLDTYGNERLFHYNRNLWKKYEGIKILSFSRSLNSAILSHGLPSKYVQYFPDPSKFQFLEFPEGDLSGFFWERLPEHINWNTIKTLIGESNFSSFHLHAVADPGFKSSLPAESDVKKYNIQISKWFPNKQDYLDKITNSQVYFAPRPSEGIGMSFLEAMAMGKCVVAPNYGTMNEYIIHGINGLLYELEHPSALSFRRAREIGRMARLSIEIGYEEWIKKEQEIIDYIIQPPQETYSVFYPSGYHFEEIAQEQNQDEQNGVIQQFVQPDVSTFQRLKRYVAVSKAGPYLKPLWRLMKSMVQQRPLEKVENTVEVVRQTYSTLGNITNHKPDVPFGKICGRDLRSHNHPGNIKAEGGLRLAGKYKASLPNKPLVTIITVVYNRAAKLERAMKSVFNQTYDNLEYIIVDGGSTDGTLELIQKYEHAIDYYVSEPDKGIYNAINKGLSLATGEYIAVLNSDDWFTEDAVELSVQAILSSGADYSGAEEYVVQEDGSLVGIYELKPFSDVAYWAQNPCNHGTMFISRRAYERIGYYNEQYRIAADFKMQLLLIDNKDLKPCTVKKPIHYYETAGVSSVEREKTLNEVKAIIREYHSKLSDQQLDSLIAFMHDYKMTEDILKDLEDILKVHQYSEMQKKYLLDRMIQFGYKADNKN